MVEETLEGRADRIKAYSIATCVFGRDASFDPQLDSIVRIEAGRLRRSLERYCLTAGANDPIRITIPRGSYVPAFEVAGVTRAAIGPSAPPFPVPRTSLGQRGRAIYIRPFEEDRGHSAFPNFTRGLTRQIIVGLTRFTDLFVFSAKAAPKLAGATDAATPGTELAIDFLLTGGTTLTADRFYVEVLLSDAPTGRCLWGDSFERKLQPAEILDVRDEVANSIVRTLAQPYGVLFRAKARETDGTPPNSMTSYDCVIQFYQYWRHFDPDLFEPIRAGLERAILRDPGYAEAFACLSLMYANAFRFGIAVAGEDPRQRALALAHRAIDLAPTSSRGHHALALAYWFNGDVRGSIEALETGRALNPNDTDIMADLGLRYAIRAQWEKAVPLVEGSYMCNPTQPGTYRTALALYHYAHGRYEEALVEAKRVGAPGVLHGFVLVAIAAAQLGVRSETEAAVKAILAIDPGYGDHVVEDLQSRNVHCDLIRAIVDGLRKAGLPGTATGAKDPPARHGAP